MQGFYAILMKLTIKHAFVDLKWCQKRISGFKGF